MSIYRFRSCVLDTRERLLTKNGEAVGLTAKAFDVLQFMAERPGEVLTKDEILGTVWNGSIVEEGNLQVHVSKLRRALGEGNGERYIETVAGNGYRFIPAVESVEHVAAQNNGHYRPQTISLQELAGRDSEAVRLYLKGKYFHEKRTIEDLQRAIECFEKSLAYDPTNIYPYIHMCDSYRLLHAFDHMPYEKAMSKIHPILSILADFDQDNDMLQVLYGNIAMQLEWRFDKAEQCYNHALSINPSCLAALYRNSGLMIFLQRFSEALANLPKITALDPFSVPTYLRIGRLYYLMSRFDSALLYLNDAMELEPEHPEILMMLGVVLIEAEDYARAYHSLQKVLDTSFAPEGLGMIGYLYAREGKKDAAYKVIQQIEEGDLRENLYAVHLARIYFVLGEKEIGYAYLENLTKPRGSDLVALNVDPRWKSVRHEPRFRKLVEKVGLPVVS